MSELLNLVRPEILALKPYVAADYKAGMVRLNANETPWRAPGDTSETGLNSYPEIRPLSLARELAAYYGVADDRLLVTRGSSEAIDLIIRCFGRPSSDDIVICPPTFGMYGVYAQIQGCGIVNIPLDAAKGYALDTDAVISGWTDRCKLLFLCSPNNPTGNVIPAEQISFLCEQLRGRGLVVLDGAYAEFAAADPTAALLEQHENIVVLRTLSKAFGLAGARVGAVLGTPEVIGLLNRIMPPYALPTPSQDAASASLNDDFKTELANRLNILRSERERMTAELSHLTQVKKIWPSQANFLLVQFNDVAATKTAAYAGKVLVRDFSFDPYITDSIRITIGTPEQNDQLLTALARQE